MLGVIIGVTSVVMIISLGEGVKNQVVSQINKLGGDIITIKPGKLFETDKNGNIIRYNFNSTVGTSTLSLSDIEKLKSVEGVADVGYSSLITANASAEETGHYPNSMILAVTPNMQEILGQKITYGEFFTSNESYVDTTIIGSTIAVNLYNANDPIGQTIYLKGQPFTIRGILGDTPKNPLNIGNNYNNVIYIPLESGKRLSGNGLQVSEINIKISNSDFMPEISDNVKKTLLANHSGQEDFTIVRQTDYLSAANRVFDILTTFVAAIAGISLIVGGIGIMNIMLVSVSERTHEIGVRKAIGATNSQILGQFLTESAVISVMGGIIGVIFAIIASFIIQTSTSIKPSISFSTVLIATGVSTIVGVVFGITPAIKAAKKDPIEALRHD
jgi:ABC-type antimicrobial peptide transport system permease subunit